MRKVFWSKAALRPLSSDGLSDLIGRSRSDESSSSSGQAPRSRNRSSDQLVIIFFARYLNTCFMHCLPGAVRQRTATVKPMRGRRRKGLRKWQLFTWQKITTEGTLMILSYLASGLPPDKNQIADVFLLFSKIRMRNCIFRLRRGQKFLCDLTT